jgi:glycosyltransferase involved in cell wall biosynthesis
MVFLFTFDAESVVERKNPLGLIRAFRAAFKNVSDVRLVLKLARGGEGVRRSLREASGNDDRLVLIDTVLDRSEIHSLIAACDCYVSLHRAEGFGLTIAEAMALGKPVIATSYSGNADFMTPTNSLQVGYELIELERDFGPYPRGSRWADPDLRQASEFMRSTYENREWARSIGERAARDIWEYLSPESIGRRITARLTAIAPRLRHRMNASLFGRS